MGFLDTALSYPTVVFSLFFVVVAVYWLFVVLGALDIDLIDIGGDVDGLAEGAAEGIAEGAAEGLAEGAAEGLAEGAAEGLAEGAAEGLAEGSAEGLAEGAAEGVGEGVGEAAHAPGGVAGLLTALRLRSAPLTVTFSLVVAFGWFFSYLGTGLLDPTLGVMLPRFAWGTLLFIAAFVLAVPLTAVMTKPLGRIFEVHAAPGRSDLLGELCTVRTGSVDTTFGQAEVEDGGAGHLIDVRCDHPNELSRGDQALVIDYDEEREAFVIEPMEHVLGNGRPQLEEDEVIAEAVAEA